MIKKRIKHVGAILALFTVFHDGGMSDEDKAKIDIRLFKDMGMDLSDEIVKGIKQGRSLKNQLIVTRIRLIRLKKLL